MSEGQKEQGLHQEPAEGKSDGDQAKNIFMFSEQLPENGNDVIHQWKFARRFTGGVVVAAKQIDGRLKQIPVAVVIVIR